MDVIKACDQPRNGLSFGSWQTVQSASADIVAATKHLHRSTGTQTMFTAADADIRWRAWSMREKRLVDANHFEQVLKNIACALKGELTYGKIKIDVVKLIMGSLKAEPTITAESLQPLTYNENMDYLDCDEFICHKCGIHIEDWKRIKIDPDDGEKELCEYTFKHCPECGAKIIIHKSCEFCRWHLRDTTCFNDLEKSPRTTPEDSCWNWEERE